MTMFLKKPYIPPPFKGTAETVFHYATEGGQTEALQPGTYTDIAIALPVVRTDHTGVVSVTPFVYASPRNQYVRLAVHLYAQTASPDALSGSVVAVRIGERDVLFARESLRESDTPDDSTTLYGFDVEGCLYLRETDRLSLVLRTCNTASFVVDCTITSAEFIVQNERSLLGKTIQQTP